MQFTLGEMLNASARKYGPKTALLDESQSVSYTQLNQRANKFAHAIMARGLKKGDRCAILLLNCCEFVEIYFGLAKAGIIAVPINFRFTPTEINFVLNNSHPTALVMGNEFIPFIPILQENVSSVPIENYICMADPPEGACLYENIMESASDKQPEVEISSDDTFFIAYTSGTTGFPKGAVVKHGSLLEHYLLLVREFGNMTEDDTALLIMPLFHSNSTWLAQALIMIGGSVFIHPSKMFDPEYMMHIISTYNITGVSVVPAMLNMLFELPGETLRKYTFPSLRLLTSSSSPIYSKTMQQTVDFFKGVKVYEGYGSTETGLVTLLKPPAQEQKIGSVGQVSLLKKIKLLDENGLEVPQGEVGELFVKGAGVLLHEYWQNPERTADAFREDGWVTVGDMARVDEDGYYYLVDRKNDMIITGGENIYPTEVEDVISRHPAVQEVAVVGIPDPKWSENVCAVIVPKEGQDCSIEEIKTFCSDKLAKYKIPRSIELVESLPKTLTGKILRRDVRRKYWEGHEG